MQLKLKGKTSLSFLFCYQNFTFKTTDPSGCQPCESSFGAQSVMHRSILTGPRAFA